MKKTILIFLIFLLPIVSCAYDLFAYNSENVAIFYNYINDSTELEVAFSRKVSYKIVTIPREVVYMNKKLKVTRIGEKAFNNFDDLTYVSIPNTVSSIGFEAFAYSDKLYYVDIPNSVTTIESGAFRSCTSLGYIAIPNSVTSFGNCVFSGCSNLTSFAIPNSWTTIEEQTFYGCKKLSNVTIPNSVKSIGDDAFCGCSNLAYVTIPNSVKSIGEGAFSGCTQLRNITIPNGVTSIGSETFASCHNLRSVIIPNSVTSIGESAFSYCEELISVSIPESVISIGSYAFRDCKSLTSVTFPDGVASIGHNSFWNCTRLTYVSIPKSVISIGHYAFSDCTLSIVISKIENPFDIDKDVFSLGANAKLYVPVGTIDKYKEKEGWNVFDNIEEGTGPKSDDDEIPTGVNKCEKPTISYKNGKILFHSDTEGVSYQYSITDSDIKTDINSEVFLNVTYIITVFATKTGYQNSDDVTATLCWIDVDPQIEDITNSVANVRANPVLIQSNGNVLSISGVPEGAEINVYNLSGQKVGSAKAASESTDVFTTLKARDVGIVRIGSKAVKVALK